MKNINNHNKWYINVRGFTCLRFRKLHHRPGTATESEILRGALEAAPRAGVFSPNLPWQLNSALSSISVNVGEIQRERLFHYRQVLIERGLAVPFFLRKKKNEKAKLP